MSVAARLTRWWVRRTTIRTMMALDDHILRDIGVRRGEIAATVDRLLDAPEPDETPRAGSQGRSPAVERLTAS